jgi:hypothetical protein
MTPTLKQTFREKNNKLSWKVKERTTVLLSIVGAQNMTGMALWHAEYFRPQGIGKDSEGLSLTSHPPVFWKASSPLTIHRN